MLVWRLAFVREKVDISVWTRNGVRSGYFLCLDKVYAVAPSDSGKKQAPSGH